MPSTRKVTETEDLFLILCNEGKELIKFTALRTNNKQCQTVLHPKETGSNSDVAYFTIDS